MQIFQCQNFCTRLMQFNQSVNITYTGRKIFIIKP